MTKREKIIVAITLIGFVVAFLAHEAYGQYIRYPVRVAPSASQCANGNCPTTGTQTKQAAPAAEKKDETKLVEPVEAEPGVDESNDDSLPNAPSPADAEEEKEWTTPNITDDAANGGLGAITLVYPTTAQTNDEEIVAYAAAGRRAKEPVSEDGELDSETPIGSIRNVGARLKELTSAIENQQEKIDSLIGNDGEYASIIDSIKKLQESDENFQKDTRAGLASVLEAVKKQNEGFIAERVKEAVTPAPSTMTKWILIGLLVLTIVVVWSILVIKLIAWFVSLGRNSIAKVVESALVSARSAKGTDKSSDEVSL